MEFILAFGLSFEYEFFKEKLIPYVSYDTFFSSPLPTVAQCILIYLPVIITRQFFKNSKTKMSGKTFIMYLLIPLLNLTAIIMVPFLGTEIYTNGFSKNAFTIYMLVTIFATYLIFYTFQRHSEEEQQKNALLEEKLTNTHETELLELSAKSLKIRLTALEEAMENERILRHDRRHFENTIYSLLKSNEPKSIDQAIVLLEEKINSEPQRLRKWCDNETVNATIEYYITYAERNNIKTEASLVIPKELSVDSLKLSITLANLLENAIHANLEIEESERFIRIKSLYKKQLLIQIDNKCLPNVILDENGLPFTKKKNHGTGTKSVMAFASQTNSQISYKIENNTFTVRMII